MSLVIQHVELCLLKGDSMGRGVFQVQLIKVSVQ